MSHMHSCIVSFHLPWQPKRCLNVWYWLVTSAVRSCMPSAAGCYLVWLCYTSLITSTLSLTSAVDRTYIVPDTDNTIGNKSFAAAMLPSPRVWYNLMMMMMMMESPVGTTYELRSHSLLPVGARLTNKADSCGELSTAVITGKASCICGLVYWDGLTCRTFPSAALLYSSSSSSSIKHL